ncbi:aspartate aminotransferase family protein [Robertmurraya sp. DFI.2.37]|uniref:aspartate aminotransferase family protein n=1 Tax=Robertmurraya sp. DFI.2.37 TaxID=3031819 RepID=UPI001243E1BB|nr:aspartate aminotransferase family protein [Robertmurraya sp. DFI.2.37]MDF1509284.1 aspartate aminotransferase family protein [Robertmurraya sp. DFI.2.37]
MSEQSFLIKPLFGGHYPTAKYGKGIYIYDDTNKQYIDGSSGAVTASIGHAVPEIIEAMIKQAQKISFVYRSQFTTEEAERLAAKLSRIDFIKAGDYSSFFVNSGSEATETAMKIAIQYWQEQGKTTKNKVISRWTSYHGITIGSLSLSGHSERRRRFVSLLDDLPTISAPYCYRCPFHATYPSCQLQCASELESAIQRIGAEHIAAFIAEPIIGAAGAVIVPPEGYYERIKEICEQHSILFIADEVMTGIGRTGKMLAMEHWGVRPDIITLGKGISAGYTPIAATLVSEKVLAPIRQGSKVIMSGHTYSANPQSAAVSLAVLEYIEQHQLVAKAEENGQYLLSELQKLAQQIPIIGDVRGKGLLVGVEFVANYFSKFPFRKDLDVTNSVVALARDKGLLIYPASAGVEGGDGDAVIISPPLTINKQEIDQLLKIFKETLLDIQNGVMVDDSYDSIS